MGLLGFQVMVIKGLWGRSCRLMRFLGLELGRLWVLIGLLILLVVKMGIKRY